MKIVFLLAALSCSIVLCASILDRIEEQWLEFKLTHNKQYSSETEEKFRMKIFIENLHEVDKNNKLYDLGNITYKLKINKWADMLHHEFIQTVNGYKRNMTKKNNSEDRIMFIPPANVQAPMKVNWTQAGAVTPVKDQRNCGSCWSFSATGALEGQHFRKTGQLISLSEQNLIDCSRNYGNAGCNGGNMDYAFRYIKDNNGLDTETSYPYEAENDRCRYNPKNSGATDRGLVDIPSGNEETLKMAVATIGPISVAIDASHKSFNFYSEGIYYEPKCSESNLDHAVLLVGYGIYSKGHHHYTYWLVKNSWGESWGMNGYIKMAMKENNCGIATKASYPIV